MTPATIQPAKLPTTVKTVQDFQKVMQAYEGQVAQLLGTKYGMTAQEFTITCVNAIKKTPKLLECNIKSLFGSILLSAELGLKPNTPDGLAYIIPYGKEAQFQVGYKGLIEVALRSDAVKQIFGGAVYENEFYEEADGRYKYVKYTGMDTNKMELVKLRAGKLKSIGFTDVEIGEDIKKYKERLDKGKGELVLVYAICFLEGKEDPIQVSVTKDVLDKIQKLSKAGGTNFSPYNNGTDVHNMMQVKAAIKQLYKFLPKTGNPQMGRAVELDDMQIMGAYPNITEDGTVEIIDVPEQKKSSQHEKITQAIGNKVHSVNQKDGLILKIESCTSTEELDNLYDATPDDLRSMVTDLFVQKRKSVN